jgi:hypothetical protein
MTVDEVITVTNQVGKAGVSSDFKTQWIEDEMTNILSHEKMNFGYSEKSKRK